MKCKNCNKKVTRNKRGRIKKFCDRECYLEYITLYLDIKKCLHCGNEFKQKNCKDKSNFRKQKYCSVSCRMTVLNSGIKKYFSIENEFNLIF